MGRRLKAEEIEKATIDSVASAVRLASFDKLKCAESSYAGGYKARSKDRTCAQQKMFIEI